MKAIQGYTGGMNQDTAHNKRAGDTYYSAKNFRVTTEEGLSSGSLEVEKGHVRAFKLPFLNKQYIINNVTGGFTLSFLDATPNEVLTFTEGSVYEDIIANSVISTKIGAGEIRVYEIGDVTVIEDLVNGTILGAVSALVGDTAVSIINAQANLQIIGWTTIVDKIVIFSTSETADTPAYGAGQIWIAEYDEESGVIQNLNGTFLDVTQHLRYNNIVNFSSSYRIGRAVGRYETEAIQRVYWTDNYNSVRVINLADPECMAIPVENLDLSPGVSLVQPNIVSVGPGSLQSGTMVQFGYRLLDTAGAETLYSPLTGMVPLPEADYTDDYQTFEGSGDGFSTAANKSVTFEIIGLDTDYDVIEYIIVVYTAPGVKTIYKFSEQEVPSSGNVTVTCDSIADAQIVTLTEFNLLSSGFDKAKDIEVKENRLIAANTSTQNFDISFDARAYRFDSGSDFEIADATGTRTAFIADYSSNYSNIPEDHDAINPFNDESSATWAADQYKYKADGTTIGGEGPNISYEFVEYQMPGNFNLYHPSATEHVSVDSFPAGENITNSGIIEADGSDRITYYSGQLKNFASSWATTHFLGYTRNEVYRFGVIFYSKKGSPSFVKWIGDIKFPTPADGYPVMIDDNGFPNLMSLGVEFTIDISSIKDQISGYSFVRVNRGGNDATKLGSGVQLFLDTVTATGALPNIWERTGPNLGGATDPYNMTPSVNIYGALDSVQAFHLTDIPGLGFSQMGSGVNKRLTVMLGPLGQLRSVTHKTGDYIDTRGYYNSVLALYGGDQAAVLSARDYAFYYKLGGSFITPSSIAYADERFEILDARRVSIGEYIAPGDDLMSASFLGGVYSARNASYCAADTPAARQYYPLGLGSPKLFIILHDAPTIANNTGDPGDAAGNTGNMRYYGANMYTTLNFAGASVIDGPGNGDAVYFKEIQYCRYVANQYGGNTYADRSKNQYMSTNHFQPTIQLTTTSFTSKVYGGDTFVSYYDDEYIQYYQNQGTATGIPYDTPEERYLSVAVTFPVESVYNPEFRTGRTWAKNRNGASMTAYESNNWSYNSIWSQENETEEKFFGLDFLTTLSEIHPHQLWASENKIDGELIDSWRAFKANNATEVNGVFGPINRIIEFKGNLFFYQDRAFGIASIDDRVFINDSSGQQIEVGTGGVFPDYRYISTNTGSYHQFSVVASENALYHYDARLKKFYQYSGQGSNPLSDLKGMSSFFDEQVKGGILKKDKTLAAGTAGVATGIHGVPDFRYNRVLYTFLKHFPSTVVDDTHNGSTGFVFPAGSYITQDDEVYYFEDATTYLEANPLLVPDMSVEYPNNLLDKEEMGFTIGFNEMLQSFESFYDYVPNIYLQYGRRLLSASPFSRNIAYVHNEGNSASYYGIRAYTSILHTILGQNGNQTKIWNNLEYKSELYDSDGADIYNETFDRIRLYNEYQDTGVINLNYSTDIIPDNGGGDIKRRMRTWRYAIPRDSTDGKSRLRNPWLHCILEYDNAQDKRLIMHELIYSYTPNDY